MKVRAQKYLRQALYVVRFALENFTDDEIYFLAKFGPVTIEIPEVTYSTAGTAETTQGDLATYLENLPRFEFFAADSNEADILIRDVLEIIKLRVDQLMSMEVDYIGDEVYEVKAGEAIRRINEGAKKALDKKSEEYREVIEKNREAFEKLSKL
jgi:hypothetical protein